MPVDAKGGYRLHPGAVSMHNAQEPQQPDPGKQEGGKVEVVKGPHEQAPTAKYHTIHDGGEVKGHETLHDAHHAINEQMGEDGCVGCEQHGGGDSEDTEGSGHVEPAGDEY